MDIYEYVKNALGLEYISDLRSYKDKHKIDDLLCSLKNERYSEEEINNLIQYIEEQMS